MRAHPTLSALNRPHQLRLHIRGALNNGVTKKKIREVFLQAAIYCGVPAAVDSFRNAREVCKETDAQHEAVAKRYFELRVGGCGRVAARHFESYVGGRSRPAKSGFGVTPPI